MRPRPIMAETNCDVVHCPTEANKHCILKPRVADVVNQFALYAFDGTRDYILMNIDCM